MIVTGCITLGNLVTLIGRVKEIDLNTPHQKESFSYIICSAVNILVWVLFFVFRKSVQYSIHCGLLNSKKKIEKVINKELEKMKPKTIKVKYPTFVKRSRDNIYSIPNMEDMIQKIREHEDSALFCLNSTMSSSFVHDEENCTKKKCKKHLKFKS